MSVYDVGRCLTVSAGLYGGLDVADALDGHAVLVVAVDELIFQLADLVDQDSELVGDIRHVLVTGFAPDGQLLLAIRSAFQSHRQSIPHANR